MMWEKNEIKNIAKLTSYGSYLDCEFTTAKYPDEEEHIVGDLAEYVYDLEQQLTEKDKEIEELKNHRNRLANTLDNFMFGKNDVDVCKREFIDEIRHQVCEEIRERIENDFEYDCEYTYEKLSEIIDQVEKGEIK